MLSKRIPLVLLALVLAGCGLAALLGPDGRPVSDGLSPAAQLEQRLSDRLPLRDSLSKLRTRCLIATGKRELDGVIVGTNRLLEPLMPEDLSATGENVAFLNDYALSQGSRTATQLMLVPTAAAFYRDELPPLVDTTDQAGYIKQVYDRLPLTGRVDLYGSMSAGSTANLYYRTDSHWTSYGAYLGYAAAARALGLRPVTADAFHVEYVCADFLGDLYHRVLYGAGMADTVSLYHYAGGDPVTQVQKLTPKGTKSFQSVFFREALDGKDPYQVFLGAEDTAVVRIRTNRQNGQRLLLYKDDTANPLLSFLSLHYEEILVIDPDRLTAPLTAYCDPTGFDRILFVYGVQRFGRAPLFDPETAALLLPERSR